MPKYSVSCTIDVEAENPQEAAVKVVGIMHRKPPATYTIVGEDDYRFHAHFGENEIKQALERIWI